MFTIARPAGPAVLALLVLASCRGSASVAEPPVSPLLAGRRGLDHNRLTPAQVEEGWELLFDGQTTRGWRTFRRSSLVGGWEVENGCLARTGPGGDLVTTERFEDFVLELEWRIAPGGDSGVLFRVAERESEAGHSGPEYQLVDNSSIGRAGDRRETAGANRGLHAPTVDATRLVGEFNRSRLEVRGDRVRHWLNGEPVVEYRLGDEDWARRVAAGEFGERPGYGRTRRGHVALQDGGSGVWFRNVRILRLR